MAEPPEQVLALVGKRLSEHGMSKDNLLKLLKRAEAALSDLCSSSSLQSVLTSLSNSLVQNNLFKHKDEDVRLWVAVCFTDIICLLAPDPPFSYEVFKDFFRLVLPVFKRLTDTNSPYFARRLKILEAFAHCKSFLVILGSWEDLVVEIFEVLFKVVRYKDQRSLVQAILLVMKNILDQQVTPSILYVILRNVLKHDKAASFRLALSVIQDCALNLETLLCGFLTSCMLDKENGDQSHDILCGRYGNDGKEVADISENRASVAELKSSYHDIILKIYPHAPQLLTSVLPILGQELLIDQVDARLKAVQLVGKLLVLSNLCFGQDHRPVFIEFLRRFSDKSVEVRLASLEWAKKGYLVNPIADEAQSILVAVEGRLLDFDDKVRSQAVAVICNLATSDIPSFPLESVLKTTKRLRDKKTCVRKSAMQNLLELYRCYCINCYNGLFKLNEVYEKIPCGILMLCFDKDCKEFRPQKMEVVFAMNLFPSSLSVSERKKHWIALFSQFTEPHLKVLNKILVQKHRLQLELKAYLALRATEEVHESEIFKKRVFDSFSKMAYYFVDPFEANDCFKKLHNMKDEYIFKSLQGLVDECTSFTTARSIQDSLLERIGRKSPYYNFFRILCLKCSYNIFDSELVQSVLEEIIYRQSCGDKDARCCYELILFIVEVCPALVRGTEDLLKILLETTGIANKKLLQILAIARKHTLIQLSDVYQCLEKTCFVGSRAESKFAVMAISCFVESTHDLTFSNLCQKLVESLQSGQNIPTILQSLSIVAHCSFRTYKPYEKDVTNFIVQKIFNSEKVYSAFEEIILTGNLRCSSFCKMKIYGMKALVKTFLPNHPTQVRQEIEELLDILINTIHGNSIVYSNISSDKDKECIRLTAVKLLLLCATRFDSYISQKPFHVIIASARDPSSSVRKAFLHKIHELLTNNLIPLRYVCAFALASTDCIREIRTDSMKYLSEFIEIRRRYILLQKLSTTESEQVINCPEYAVVFLLHFLAHDQGFPSSLENKELYHELCSPLVIFLRALVNLEPFGGNSRADNETLSNLFVVLLAIKKAEDAVDASITPKLHVLTDIALIILRILCKSLKPSLNKRQMVLLPLSFYKARKSCVCEGHDLDKSFIDDNFVKGILDVVDSSFIKPCTSSSKQLGRTQTGSDHKGNMRDYPDFLLNARQGNPSTSISKMQKDIDFHNGDAFDTELLQEKTRSPQPFKIYSAVTSASSGFYNENCDVSGSRNEGLNIPNVVLFNQQLSSCDSASAVLHFSGPLTSTAEPDAETLNPQLTSQSVTKYEFATFCSSKKTLNDDHFMSKNKLVHEGEGLVGNRISVQSSIDNCSYSGTFDSCDSLQNNYKGSFGILT